MKPMKREKIELLSPAGKMLALKAAVANGADAVYLGEKEFSARKGADNFTWEELEEALRYCHARGAKVHLTLNTLLYDRELKAFEKCVEKCAETGVDAVIVQDLGAADMIKNICPELSIHGSTQLTAANEKDVEALLNRGFSRVVLSRELSWREVEKIYKNTNAELEVFAHGALCVSFSGKCLMTSFIGGRSGNRGMCAQPCRQCYFSEGKRGFFLSPRDLCLADEIKLLSQVGVSSLKIEGRMKSPEYVAAVTRIYRKYIDNPLPLSQDDEDSLKKIFVRGDGFTKAYFKEINTPQMMNYSISNDKLSSRADSEALARERQSYREGFENKKLDISAFLKVKKGIPSSLTLTDRDGNSVTSYGDIPEKAIHVAINEESARERIDKFGQTIFALKEFNCEIDENLSLSAASLNKLRRDGAAFLYNKRSAPMPRPAFGYSYPDENRRPAIKKPAVIAQVRNALQFEAVQKADRILLPIDLWDKVKITDRCSLAVDCVVTNVSELDAWLKEHTNVSSIYVSSLGMGLLASKHSIPCHGDWSMNILNSVSLNAVSSMFESITLSPELSLREISKITSSSTVPCEALVYGKQVVMTSRACIIKGVRGRCDCEKPLILKDKTGAEFTVYGNPRNHLNTILNSRPTFMADKQKELNKCGLIAYRLCFSDETPSDAEKIVAMHKGLKEAAKPESYTRGYFLK